MARKKKIMLNDYERPEDVNMRLNESVIFYDGKPCYALSNDVYLDLYQLRSEMPYIARVKAANPLIDVRSPQLGFLNHRDMLFWVFRTTVRKQKQGLCGDNTCIARITSLDNPNRISSKTMCTIYFEDMLLGRYPSYEDAMKSKHSIAFARHFAIHRNEETEETLLYHLDRPVAFLDEESMKWHIYPEEDNTVLRMYLGDLGVPIA